MSQHYQQLATILKNATNVAIFGHSNPDGDCIGACLGTMRLLQQLGKKVDCFVPDEPSSFFTFLPGAEKIHVGFTYNDNYDLCIFLDCASPQRVGGIVTDRPEYFADTNVLVIDHHPDNPGFGSHNLIDASASSTCELLTEIIQTHYPKQIDKQIATALFLGISDDTGNFLYDNDSVRTFRAAVYLLAHGADKQQIIQQIYMNNGLPTIQFLGTLLERIQQHETILYSWYSDKELKELGIDKAGATEHFLRLFVSIDHEGAFLLFKKMMLEEQPHLRCSLRAKHDRVNVGKLATHFGGGGHKPAAGMAVLLKQNDYDKTIETTVKQANNLLQKEKANKKNK